MLYIAEKIYHDVSGSIDIGTFPEATFVVSGKIDVKYFSEFFRDGVALSMGDCILHEDAVQYFNGECLTENLEDQFEKILFSVDPVPDDGKPYMVIRESRIYSIGNSGKLVSRNGNTLSVKKCPEKFYVEDRKAFVSLDEDFLIHELNDVGPFDDVLENETIFSINAGHFKEDLQLKNITYISDINGNLGEVTHLNPLSYDIKMLARDERLRRVGEYVLPDVLDSIPNTHIGYTGSQGENGEIGYTGSIGELGYTGSQGELGYTGSQGERGFIGSQGTVGYTGSNGFTGSQGEKGEGILGYTGSQGERGYDGSNGSQGVIGYTGSQGERGFIGSHGNIGYTGSEGLIGYTGSQGEAGDVSQVVEEYERVKDFYMKDFSKFKSTITTMISSSGIGGGSSGGGSVRILDNDDVVFNKPSELNNNDVLIFDQEIQKFKAINIVTIIDSIRVDLEMQYDRLVFEEVIDGITYTYIGEAAPGGIETDAVWRIKRVVEYNNGLTEILWADNSDSFDKIWTDRTSYGYDR